MLQVLHMTIHVLRTSKELAVLHIVDWAPSAVWSAKLLPSNAFEQLFNAEYVRNGTIYRDMRMEY